MIESITSNYKNTSLLSAKLASVLTRELDLTEDLDSAKAAQLPHIDYQVGLKNLADPAAMIDVFEDENVHDVDHFSAQYLNTNNHSILKRQRSRGDIENESPRSTKRVHLDSSIPVNTPYNMQHQENNARTMLGSPSKQRMFASPGNGLGCWSDRRVLVPKVDLNNPWNMGVDDEPLMRYYRENTSQTLSEQLHD